MQVSSTNRWYGNSLLNAGVAVMLLLATGSNISRAAEPLKLNAEKSKISFVGHKADGKHEGGFKKFDVDAKADFEEPTKSTMKIVIKTDSLWSDDEKLTAHLKNPDFFDIRKYPEIVFESTKVETTDEDGKATISGKLKLLDKTEELTVPANVEVGESSLKIVATFKLDRTKWGMNYGKGKINDEVDVTAELVFGR
jgi:polyisoprenoid-binding protein YceI